MTPLRRGGTATSLGFVAVLLGAGPSYAAGSFQDCVNQAIDHNGEPPTCTKVNGTWVASWPDQSAGLGGGIPGAFVGFAVVAVLAAIALTVWKVSTAQKLARQSGTDPALATRMTLLTDDGLDATYLASSLRQPVQPPASPPTPAPTPAPTVASRLEELTGLLEQGLVTQTEYDERRKAIIDSV
jgi:hypothetical protein